MKGNERLAALMTQAGFLNEDGSIGLKVFARAVSRFGPRVYTHTYVRRWLDGKVPREAQTRQAIASALGERLGRTIAQAELGFGRSERLPADLGLHYPDAPDDGVSTLARLWQADLDQLRALLGAPANAAAWNEAALSWVVSPNVDTKLTSKGDRQVGAVDIARLQATTGLFERLDSQYGGGHARSSLIEFLQRDVTHLLRGRYTDRTGRKLFRAVAQSTMLAAWMSYDSGLHGLAQRYFVQALALADSSGDRLFAGGVLDAMSHQATFLGRYREAANLARAARTGTEALRSATLTAHFCVMEARALARLGDASACDRAMSVAVREFERRRPDSDPAWFRYFDDAEFAAELGHCNRDLGRAVDAATYAAQSVGVNEDQVRSDFFVTMVLADAHLAQGDVAEACRVALTALETGDQIESVRCAAYVDEFRERLDRAHRSPVVRDFEERAAHMRLWGKEARTVPSLDGSRRS